MPVSPSEFQASHVASGFFFAKSQSNYRFFGEKANEKILDLLQKILQCKILNLKDSVLINKVYELDCFELVIFWAVSPSGLDAYSNLLASA